MLPARVTESVAFQDQIPVQCAENKLQMITQQLEILSRVENSFDYLIKERVGTRNATASWRLATKIQIIYYSVDWLYFEGF